MARGGQPSRKKDVATRDDERARIAHVLEQIIEEKGPYLAEVVQRSFSGPLPPPDLLREYNQIVPGLAERIARMAEKEQDHRHYFERKLVRIFGRGQIFGYSIGLLALIIGSYLIVIGKDGYGVGMMISAVAVLAGSFVFTQRQKEGKKTRRNS